MTDERIFLDHHSTTPIDPRVVEAVIPWMTDRFGNPGSLHCYGREAREGIDDAFGKLRAALGGGDGELIFTSGATESNNLALKGIAAKYQTKGRHIISVETEHPSVIDPLHRLKRGGFDVTLLPVQPVGSSAAGLIELDDLRQAIRDDTILVSVMMANNEIGVLQPISKIAEICHENGVLLHCDATQAVGKVPVDVGRLDIDLMSFSSHKIYGPRGVGGLYVRRRPRIRLEPLIDGGGQQRGLRSGTLNTPGIVGFATAVEIAVAELEQESARLRLLRDRLWSRIRLGVPDVAINGPSLESSLRLPGNLNLRFPDIDAESLMLQVPEIAVSTGSACTAENPEPSPVLLAIGLSEDEARCSIRIGLGRFNTADQIDRAADRLVAAAMQLGRFKSES